MRVDIFLNINNYMNTANDNVHDVLDMNNYRVEKLKKNKKEIKILSDRSKTK
ncbi:hypothetical protein MASR1M46_20660 [Bacteroidales bacterium]